MCKGGRRCAWQHGLRLWLTACFILSAVTSGAADLRRSALIGRLGESHVTVESDTLADIAVDRGLGYLELVAANPGVDPWLPGAGVKLLLPTAHVLPATERRGIVINLAELRLYLFVARQETRSYPIGIGTDGIAIPIGASRIVRKRTKPAWIPTASALAEDDELPHLVPPGPDNPLGDFALDLAWPRFVIHGTNRPYGVGRRVSHGCFRMYPEHIRELFAAVRIGLPVLVVDQPIKAGWQDGELYLQVHPTLEEASDLDDIGRIRLWREIDPVPIVTKAAGVQLDRVDWTVVHRATLGRLGVPVRVTSPPGEAAPLRLGHGEQRVEGSERHR
jgi:L,D-transpeptidase ErfK/SrfK